MPAPPRAKPEIEDEEDDDVVDMDEEELELDDGGADMFDALGSLLATEEGETVATTLVTLKDAVEKIVTAFELQNKILVKILTALNKPTAA
jgi:hypothetical protein